MDFAGFPRSVAACGRLLLAREATTGYRTLQLCPDITLAHNYSREGGYVVTMGDRPLLTFCGNGKVRISRRCQRANVTAIINALLPRPYQIERDTDAKGAPRFWLLLDGHIIATFSYDITFTPHPMALAAVA